MNTTDKSSVEAAPSAGSPMQLSTTLDTSTAELSPLSSPRQDFQTSGAAGLVTGAEVPPLHLETHPVRKVSATANHTNEELSPTVKRALNFFKGYDVSNFSNEEGVALRKHVRMASKRFGVTAEFLKKIPLNHIKSIFYAKAEDSDLLPIGTYKNPNTKVNDTLYRKYHRTAKDAYFLCIPETGDSYGIEMKLVKSLDTKLSPPFKGCRNVQDLDALFFYYFYMARRMNIIPKFSANWNKTLGSGLWGACFFLRNGHEGRQGDDEIAWEDGYYTDDTFTSKEEESEDESEESEEDDYDEEAIRDGPNDEFVPDDLVSSPALPLTSSQREEIMQDGIDLEEDD